MGGELNRFLPGRGPSTFLLSFQSVSFLGSLPSRIYTLLRIVNVEKRRDSARGNRYLVELELMERGRSVVRLSEYIYLLLHRSKHGEESRENTDSALTSPLTLTTPPSHTPSSSSARAAASPASTAYAKPLLCQPLALRWRRDVMVHFVVPGQWGVQGEGGAVQMWHLGFCPPPVKNQARWVQQFISDMEELHRQTQDDNFSIIIVDFESEDMDVEKALRQSGVPRLVLRPMPRLLPTSAVSWRSLCLQVRVPQTGGELRAVGGPADRRGHHRG